MMRRLTKLVAILLAVYMILLSGPLQSVWATMIGTESILEVNQRQSPSDDLNRLLARVEIQAVLIANGIDPQEARERIDNLSGQEISKFVHEIDQLPAGGGSTAGVVTLIIMFLIAVVADLFYNEPTPDN